MFVALAGLYLIAAPVSAPLQLPVPEVTEAQKWARETGYVAGAAKFCSFDQDLIENFISRAYAKLAETATDKEDLIVARIEFSNTMSSASSKEPGDGCEDFKETFRRESARI